VAAPPRPASGAFYSEQPEVQKFDWYEGDARMNMDTSEFKEAGYGSVKHATGAARNGRCHGTALAVLGLITMLLVCMAVLDTRNSRIILWSDPLVREHSTPERDIIHRDNVNWWNSDLHKAWSDPMSVEEERRRSQAHDVIQEPATSYPDHKNVPTNSLSYRPAEVSHQPR
jgi:hypothetical protein